MIRINGKLYRRGGLGYLTLRDLLDLDLWLVNHNRSISHWWELPQLAEDLRALPDRFAAEHPEAFIPAAVMAWASLRRAGVQISFDETLDAVDVGQLQMLDDEDAEPVEQLPRGFEAGNTQAAPALDFTELDLLDEVYSRLVGVMRTFPGITADSVWDLPLNVWLGVAAHMDYLSRG